MGNGFPKDLILKTLKFLMDDVIIIVVFIIFWSLLFVQPEFRTHQKELKKVNEHLQEIKILIKEKENFERNNKIY